jgi:RAB6A-GEF complex partner protein 2
MESTTSLTSSTSRIEMEVPTTSIDNIANTIQNAGRVSYDICKNNEHIAQLSLPRLGYKLGDNVVAVLEFQNSSIPCYHVSVYLETHETIEPFFAGKTKTHIANHTRACYGEFHEHTLNSKRATVSLTIPPNATPDFQSSAGIVL